MVGACYTSRIPKHRFSASCERMPSPETPCMDRAAGSPSWLFMQHGLETVRNKVVGKGILHSAPCDRVTNGFLAVLRSGMTDGNRCRVSKRIPGSRDHPSRHAWCNYPPAS